jgi:NAD(P)-dependent dehydrogenase (short-subunit alcohol dehydrogenase family)
MQALGDKRVLVTGAASGIGRAIAERIAAAEDAELLLVA